MRREEGEQEEEREWKRAEASQAKEGTAASIPSEVWHPAGVLCNSKCGAGASLHNFWILLGGQTASGDGCSCGGHTHVEDQMQETLIDRKWESLPPLFCPFPFFFLREVLPLRRASCQGP